MGKIIVTQLKIRFAGLRVFPLNIENSLLDIEYSVIYQLLGSPNNSGVG